MSSPVKNVKKPRAKKLSESAKLEKQRLKALEKEAKAKAKAEAKALAKIEKEKAKALEKKNKPKVPKKKNVEKNIIKKIYDEEQEDTIYKDEDYIALQKLKLRKEKHLKNLANKERKEHPDKPTTLMRNYAKSMATFGHPPNQEQKDKMNSMIKTVEELFGVKKSHFKFPIFLEMVSIKEDLEWLLYMEWPFRTTL